MSVHLSAMRPSYEYSNPRIVEEKEWFDRSSYELFPAIAVNPNIKIDKSSSIVRFMSNVRFAVETKITIIFSFLLFWLYSACPNDDVHTGGGFARLMGAERGSSAHGRWFCRADGCGERF